MKSNLINKETWIKEYIEIYQCSPSKAYRAFIKALQWNKKFKYHGHS
jgi:hypothetical protein